MPKIKRGARNRRSTFLRAWREAAGLSQEAVADLLEVDRTTVSRVEAGIIPYNQDFLERAAECYRCTPADLLGRDPSGSESLDLVGLFRSAPPEARRIVEMILRAPGAPDAGPWRQDETPRGRLHEDEKAVAADPPRRRRRRPPIG